MSGPYRSVIHRDIPCHCIPRLKMPSAPPIIRSDWRNRPGPTVLARHGTSVVRLLKLVSAFCSMVSGCSFAPRRYGWLLQSSTDWNSRPKWGSQKAIWHILPIP